MMRKPDMKMFNCKVEFTMKNGEQDIELSGSVGSIKSGLLCLINQLAEIEETTVEDLMADLLDTHTKAAKMTDDILNGDAEEFRKRLENALNEIFGGKE